MKKITPFAAFTALVVIFTASSQLSADEPKLTTTVQAVEFQRDGKVIGIRLFNVTPESGFGRSGFLNGDVIKSMNDTPISDLSQVLGIIADSESVSAIVLRADKDIELKFAGRRVSSAAGITKNGSGQKTAK